MFIRQAVFFVTSLVLDAVLFLWRSHIMGNSGKVLLHIFWNYLLKQTDKHKGVIMRFTTSLRQDFFGVNQTYNLQKGCHVRHVANWLHDARYTFLSRGKRGVPSIVVFNNSKQTLYYLYRPLEINGLLHYKFKMLCFKKSNTEFL